MTSMSGQTCFGETRENKWGLYPGVAGKVIDDEGKPKITVIFDWIYDGYESDPAHIAQIYAGDGHGAVWMPEEGDQVVVAFMNGQLNNPVVLGSIYNNKNQPLMTRTDSADPKLFQTKGGNYLLMEDGSGTRVEIGDKDGAHKVTLDTDNDLVVVESSGDVEVKAAGNLKLSAGGDITIEASGSVSVSGSSISLN